MCESMVDAPNSDQWSRGHLAAVTSCPACGQSSDISAEFVRRDDELAMPDEWRVVRCAGCGSLYLNPRPDRRSLPRAYADYYTHGAEADTSADNSRSGAVAALVNGYLNWRFCMRRKPAWHVGAWLFLCLPPLAMKLNVHGRHLPRSHCRPGVKLLDVGCGNGSFLLRAREMGIDAEGCEPDRDAVGECFAHGLKVVCGDVFSGGFDKQQFDVITLNHVIEHVEDPSALLAELYNLLVPGGVLWLALPNPEALGLALFGIGWKGLHPPFHLVIPQQKILLKWLEDVGFQGAHCIRRGAQSPGMWRDSMEISVRQRTAPSSLATAFIRGIGDLLCTASARWGEETIVIARKPK